MVSGISFGGHLPPEPDLVRELINMMFTQECEDEMVTRQLSPYKEEKSDTVPTVRSFLLQLLLKHKYVAYTTLSFIYAYTV